MRNLDLRWVIAVGAVLNIACTGLFVWSSTEARKENCADIIDAFDEYTATLAEFSGADESIVAEFRAAYEPELEDCA